MNQLSGHSGTCAPNFLTGSQVYLDNQTGDWVFKKSRNITEKRGTWQGVGGKQWLGDMGRMEKHT